MFSQSHGDPEKILSVSPWLCGQTKSVPVTVVFASGILLSSVHQDTKGLDSKEPYPPIPAEGLTQADPPAGWFYRGGSCMCRWLALSVSVFGLSSSLVLAQIGSATLTGRVTDPSGAVVPGVSITVVQNGTNFEFSALTNAEGIYRVQSLQPGAYRITFEISGFKRVVHEGVELRVGDTVPVDIVLQIGAASDSIEITAQTQMLETETSATGAVQ